MRRSNPRSEAVVLCHRTVGLSLQVGGGGGGGIGLPSTHSTTLTAGFVTLLTVLSDSVFWQK